MQQRLLVAQLESELARACAASGAHHLASRYDESARGSYERIAATLPEALSRVFRDRVLGRVESSYPQAGAVRDDAAVADWKRLVEINRRLNSADTPDEVLRETIDTAVATMTGRFLDRLEELLPNRRPGSTA